MVEASRVVIHNNLPLVINKLRPAQLKSLKEAIGLRVQNALTDKIKSGDSSWAPLSKAWAEEKGHGNPWYYTGRLENAIEYEINDAGVKIGILKQDTYPDSGTNIAVVAATLEFGGSNIPGRPLLVPVFDENIDRIIKDAATDIKNRIKQCAI